MLTWWIEESRGLGLGLTRQQVRERDEGLFWSPDGRREINLSHVHAAVPHPVWTRALRLAGGFRKAVWSSVDQAQLTSSVQFNSVQSNIEFTELVRSALTITEATGLCFQWSACVHYLFFFPKKRLRTLCTPLHPSAGSTGPESVFLVSLYWNTNIATVATTRGPAKSQEKKTERKIKTSGTQGLVELLSKAREWQEE